MASDAIRHRAQRRVSEAEFFSGAEDQFPSKLPRASLNLPTYVALYDYTYRNVGELGPLVDITATAIAFAGSAAPAPR